MELETKNYEPPSGRWVAVLLCRTTHPWNYSLFRRPVNRQTPPQTRY